MSDEEPTTEAVAERERLSKIADELQEVLKKHDVMGYCVIASTDRVNWLLWPNASWSCLHIDEQTLQARMRAKRADFKTPEQHEAVVHQTVTATFGSRTVLERLTAMVGKLCLKIQDHLDVQQESSVFETQRPDGTWEREE